MRPTTDTSALPTLPTSSLTSSSGQGPGFILIGALYLTQGLPLGFLFEALPVLLRQNGASLDLIALLPITALPWIFKFLWAPLVDNHGGARLGRRRSWILPMQAILIVTLLLSALLPPEPENVLTLIVLFFIGSMAAATQDTATDGLAAETLTGPRLVTANALQAAGMMAGFMLGGAGALIVADTAGYSGALTMLAFVTLLSLVPILLWREPLPTMRVDGASAPKPARLRHTLKREGVFLLLLLSLAYGTAHSAGLSLSRLMLTDAGWSLADIGLLAATGGLGMIFIGAPVGSRLTTRFGIWRTFVAGLLLAIIATALWLILAQGLLPLDTLLPALATLALGTAGGIISVAAGTLSMRFAARGVQAGTDMTVLQSAHVTGDMMSGGLAVALAAAAGYGEAFCAVIAVTLLTLLLVVRMMRRPALHDL